MNTPQLVELAKKHVNNGAAMQSSAKLCLDDALNLLELGGCEDVVRIRALKSLKYSVGIFHPDYQVAEK